MTDTHDESLAETLAILADDEAMESIANGLADIANGDVEEVKA
jgi:PHD/YefM family antitoxin component YafN of YafNO toxin-antitoxin module